RERGARGHSAERIWHERPERHVEPHHVDDGHSLTTERGPQGPAHPRQEPARRYERVAHRTRGQDPGSRLPVPPEKEREHEDQQRVDLRVESRAEGARYA